MTQQTDRSEPAQTKTGGWRQELPARVRAMLHDAVAVDVTDVHMDPVAGDQFRICHRVDGVIHPVQPLSAGEGRRLINQIKVAAELPPDQTRTPLEGRISLDDEKGQREVRVTILPTSRGEAVHLRMLSPPAEVLKPEELGLSDAALDSVVQSLKRPQGLILVTGPTGAGKTMTLYSLLSFLNLDRLIAASVEDPVEFDLSEVRQVLVDEEHGVSMPRALKTLLRMDPDILMIGEIRDAASAMTAARAAASGRFVLATLHAGDVALAMQACQHYSVPRHLVGSTLRMVISQNLMRRVCADCAEPRAVTEEERQAFEAEGVDVPEEVLTATGCESCNHYGYRGRIGVFEVAPIRAPLAELITSGAPTAELRTALAVQGAPSLRGDALNKVARGITTLEEVADLHFPGTSVDRRSA